MIEATPAPAPAVPASEEINVTSTDSEVEIVTVGEAFRWAPRLYVCLMVAVATTGCLTSLNQTFYQLYCDCHVILLLYNTGFQQFIIGLKQRVALRCHLFIMCEQIVS